MIPPRTSSARLSWRGFSLLLILPLAAVLLVLPGGAQAYISDSGSGESRVTTYGHMGDWRDDGGSGGGGGSGVPTVYDIYNSEKDLNWPSSASLDASRGLPLEKKSATEVKLSRELGSDRCGSSYSASQCVLWNMKTRKSHPTWGSEIHHPRKGDEAIAGWNIRIWREGEKKPILERRVCDNESSTGTNTDRWIGARNPRWANCGQVSRADGGYSIRGKSRAGMLGFQGKWERRNCTENWERGDNGLRNASGSLGGKTVPSSSASGRAGTARPAKLPESTFCYWEGKDLGSYSYGASRYNSSDAGQLNTTGPRRDQFGPGEDGIRAAGLKEAVFLKWTLNSSSRQQTISYRIDGAPNKFYAVQIIALNDKEKLMPIFEDSKFRVGGENKQYFRVFKPNPATPDEGLNCEDPAHPDYPCDAPGGEQTNGPEAIPQVELTADSPLQVREAAEQTVSLTLDDTVLADTQALFPTFTALLHLSPQTRFNGNRGGGGYNSNYITYDSDMGPMSRLPAGNATANAKKMNMVWLPQAPRLTNLSRNVGDLSSNEYSSTWLQGTLSNPCATQDKNWGINIDSDPDNNNPNLRWPTSQDECKVSGQPKGKNVLNAWDDNMVAWMNWESRWVAKSSATPAYGYVRKELQRCNSPFSNSNQSPKGEYTTQGADSTCPDQHRFYGSLNYKKGSDTQHFQGMLRLDNPAGKDGGSRDNAKREHAAARAFVYTNAENNIAQMAMWDRVNGEIKGLSGDDPSQPNGRERSNVNQPLINTRTRLKELNFCSQGLPEGTSIYRDQADPAKDDAVKSSQLGDPDCGGYAVNWKWSGTDVDCNVNKGARTPTANYFGRWYSPTSVIFNANRNRPGDRQVNTRQTQDMLLGAKDPKRPHYKGWGIYGEEQPGSQKSYLVGNWENDSQMRDYAPKSGYNLSNPKRPPYAGKRPGRGTLEANCSRRVEGKWRTGKWTRKWVFTKTTTSNDDLFVRAYSPSGNYISDRSEKPPYQDGDRDIPYSSRPSGAPAGEATESSRRQTGWTDYGPWANGEWHTHKNCHGASYDTDTRRESRCENRKFNETAKHRHQSNHTNWPNSSAYTGNPDIGYGLFKREWNAKLGRWDVRHGGWTVDSRSQYRTKTDKTATRVRYSFGYWSYKYEWVWGSSDPENCIDEDGANVDDKNGWWDTNNNGRLDISETNASGNVRYAGPLTSPREYGRTKFVWSHGASTPASGYYGGEETRYNAASGGTRARTNGRNTSVTGGGVWANSQDCSVRRSGKKESGAWVVDINDNWDLDQDNVPGSNREPTGEEVFADAGWGKNNTGRRVANGQYLVQFTFDRLGEAENGVPRPLNEPSQYCKERSVLLSNNPGTDMEKGSSPQYCWAMRANYDGRKDFKWRHAVRNNNPYDDSSSELIRVYGPRSTR